MTVPIVIIWTHARHCGIIDRIEVINVPGFVHSIFCACLCILAHLTTDCALFSVRMILGYYAVLSTGFAQYLNRIEGWTVESMSSKRA